MPASDTAVDLNLSDFPAGVGLEVIARAVVNVHRAAGAGWTEVGWGVLVWAADLDGCQYFKLHTPGGKMLLNEEIHEDFASTYKAGRTITGTHAVHTCELGAAGVYALTFSAESEGAAFARKVSAMAPRPTPKTGGGGGRWRLGGGRRRDGAHAPTPAVSSLAIGSPTNVKHEAHVGWDAERGFEVRNLPDEWKALLKSAGVRRRDLEDQQTARKIVDAISHGMTKEDLAAMPPLPGVTDRQAAPPPLPATPTPAAAEAPTPSAKPTKPPPPPPRPTPPPSRPPPPPAPAPTTAPRQPPALPPQAAGTKT